MKCLEHNQKCIKPVFVAATADCEGVNKAVFCSLKDEIEQIGQIQNLHYWLLYQMLHISEKVWTQNFQTSILNLEMKDQILQ